MGRHLHCLHSWLAGQKSSGNGALGSQSHPRKQWMMYMCCKICLTWCQTFTLITCKICWAELIWVWREWITVTAGICKTGSINHTGHLNLLSKPHDISCTLYTRLFGKNKTLYFNNLISEHAFQKIQTLPRHLHCLHICPGAQEESGLAEYGSQEHPGGNLGWQTQSCNIWDSSSAVILICPAGYLANITIGTKWVRIFCQGVAVTFGWETFTHHTPE